MGKKEIIQSQIKSGESEESLFYRLMKLGLMVLALSMVLASCSDRGTVNDSSVLQEPGLLVNAVYKHYKEDADITIIDWDGSSPMVAAGIRINGTQQFSVEIDKGEFLDKIAGNSDWIKQDLVLEQVRKL